MFNVLKLFPLSFAFVATQIGLLPFVGLVLRIGSLTLGRIASLGRPLLEAFLKWLKHEWQKIKNERTRES